MSIRNFLRIQAAREIARRVRNYRREEVALLACLRRYDRACADYSATHVKGRYDAVRQARIDWQSSGRLILLGR